MQRIGPLLPVGSGDSAVHHGSRRRARRYPLNAEVTVIEPVSTRGFTLNASAVGMRIVVDHQIPEGECCLIELRFTEDRLSQETAQVVWAQEHPDGWVIGLEFLDITWFFPTTPTPRPIKAA